MDTNAWLELCDDIDDGEYDDGLDDIAKAVSSRRDIVARRNARRLMRSLEIGDKVKLTNGVKPRYLEGMVGHVQEMRQGAAVIQLTRTPTQTGAGRPPEGGFKSRLLVALEFLVKIGDDVEEPGELEMGPDIGDDHEDDDEED